MKDNIIYADTDSIKVGEASPDNMQKRKVCIYMVHAHMEKLSKIAEKQGESVASLIRRAVYQTFIEEDKPDANKD